MIYIIVMERSELCFVKWSVFFFVIPLKGVRFRMEKITGIMKLDKVFEIMRKAFKGVYAATIALPSNTNGDIFIIVRDQQIKTLPEYQKLRGRERYSDSRSGCSTMAGWIESYEFVFQSSLAINFESLKGVSMPLALYNQINKQDISIYNTVSVDRYELRFNTKAFSGDLLFEKKFCKEDGVIFKPEKKLLGIDEKEDSFIVQYSFQNIAEYCGKDYIGDLLKDSKYFGFSEENIPKEIAKMVEVIIPDSTAKAGEALYVLDPVDGIMTKRLVNKKREVTETESVGFSLSVDERRYEEDFRTSTYTIYEYGDKAEIVEEELPEAVKSNSDWIVLKNYLQLKETGEFDRLVLKAKEEARKEAKEKAEEFMKTFI